MNVIMLSYSLRLIFVLLFFFSFLISTTTQCVRAPKAFSHYEYICVLFSLFQCIVVPICVCLLLLLLHVCVYARYTSIWMYARLCQWCEQHTLWHAQRQPHRPTDRPTVKPEWRQIPYDVIIEHYLQCAFNVCGHVNDGIEIEMDGHNTVELESMTSNWNKKSRNRLMLSATTIWQYIHFHISTIKMGKINMRWIPLALNFRFHSTEQLNVHKEYTMNTRKACRSLGFLYRKHWFLQL